MIVAIESPYRSRLEVGQHPRASIWHKSAPAVVEKAYRKRLASDGWKAWRRHLRLRKLPPRPEWLFSDDQRALLWGLDEAALSTLPLPRFPKMERSAAAEALDQWLRDGAGSEFQLDYALSALGWCRCLPDLADVLPSKSWWTLLDRLLHVVADVGASSVGGEPSGDDPLLDQLLAGELPLTLAWLFPEIVACRALLPEARLILSVGLTDLLDGKGLPYSTHFDRLHGLLACWTRCRALGNRWKRGCWNAKAEKQYGRLVLNALRLARRDGSHVFSSYNAKTRQNDSDLLTAAGEFYRRRPGPKLPAAAIHSEWAAAAVMRPDWSRSAPRLTVLYPGASCRMELSRGKDVLFSGQWGLEVEIDGTPAAPTSEWSQLCWFSDKDVDYLELEIELGAGLRVQRQLLLAREDRFLFLADAVLGSRQSAVRYCGTLPLCRGIVFREACETREGLLVGRKPRALVLPLALPEWLADRRRGNLKQTASGLELRQSAVGQSLFAPLWIDLDRRRMSEPSTWRQLTVAESRTVQPNDVAVGYRVAIGQRQWLLYRSLAAPRNRTLLGHNLSTETLVARFDRRGEIEPLIEIEPPEGSDRE